jgi:DNA-binding MarR family transcriptional regulator
VPAAEIEVGFASIDALGTSFEQFYIGLRRALRSRTRIEVGLPRLPEAQGELLRLVDKRPGIGVGAAAETLQLAPNTVSTLLRQLVGAGLLERRRDPDNLRAVMMFVTPRAIDRFTRFRDSRTELLVRALASLDERTRAEVERVMPALLTLLDAVESLA